MDTIEDAINFLNFWISKERGAFYTIPELNALLDKGQIALYNDLKPIYATSHLAKEKLSPFRRTYDFTPSNTISGVISVPSNVNYLDLLDIQITYLISNRTMYWGVPLVNEDERAQRLNSQVNPVTTTNPIGEQLAPRFFRLYPAGGYTGTVTFLKRPVKPVFGYTVISGRVIVYNPATSTQLEWRESEITEVLIKALKSIGINLSDDQVQNFAQIASQENYKGLNHT